MFEIDTDSKTCFNPFDVMLNNCVSIHTQLCTKMNLQDLSQGKSITPGQLASLRKGNGQIITGQHITQLWKTPMEEKPKPKLSIVTFKAIQSLATVFSLSILNSLSPKYMFMFISFLWTYTFQFFIKIHLNFLAPSLLWSSSPTKPVHLWVLPLALLLS